MRRGSRGGGREEVSDEERREGRHDREERR